MRMMMKQVFVGFVCAALFLGVHANAESANNLMPVPSSVSIGEGVLPIKTTLAVETSANADIRLREAIERGVRRIEKATGLPHAGAGAVLTTKLNVQVQEPGKSVQEFDEDESYSLDVTATGVQIKAPTDLGAIHGLETLIQLVQADGDGYAFPLVSIHDAPRFRWRGLMVDCARHFEPIPVLKRTLDGMAAVKLNVFHWHLIDDQGFRIESRVFPKLTSAGSDGLFYTQDEARDLVAYARARGIRVVPEFEMPGHSTAWLVAYPELASGTKPDGIRREFGVSKVAIDPTREETYVFIKKFLTEMTNVFPDAYIHIGGDETPAPDWKSNPRIVAFTKAHILKDNDALQAYFNQHVLQIITGLHKHMMGWDEILTPELPKDIVVQSWRGVASLNKGAKLGYDGVLSAPYYLDGMRPAGTHYLADPIPHDTDLTPEQQKRIIGGEVCMWAEHLDARTIDSRIWPRTAAIAERFWSAQSVNDVDDMYRRLELISIELEGLGLTHMQSGDAGLRELAGTDQIDALRTFASALEPVAFGDRFKAQHTDQLTSLDRLVDAVRPDPSSKHWSDSLVKQILANPQQTQKQQIELDAWFAKLQASVPEVKQQMQNSPRLRDGETRANQLAALATIGREALAFLRTGQKPSGEWIGNANKVLNDAKEPSAIVRFTFLDPLKALVSKLES